MSERAARCWRVYVSRTWCIAYWLSHCVEQTFPRNSLSLFQGRGDRRTVLEDLYNRVSVLVIGPE